jgi:hypothetical protein
LGDQGQADAGAGGMVGDVAALVEGLKDLLAELGRYIIPGPPVQIDPGRRQDVRGRRSTTDNGKR